MQKEKILVTGGAGFIGFHLALWLAEKNNDVFILDDFSRGQEDHDFNNLISKKNVTFLKRDITKESAFNGLNGFDYIFHLAAINGTANFYNVPDKVIKVGVLGTINILDWFKNQEKGKLLFTSSSETYAGALHLLEDNFPIPTPEDIPMVINDPTNPRWSYGGSKIMGEILINSYMKAFDLHKRLCIIRYHNIYGPRMGFEHVVPQFIERILKKETPFQIYGADATRTFCYVSDAIEATYRVISSPKMMGQTVNVGRSDGELQILDLAKQLFEIANYDVPFEINKPPQGSVNRRCPDVKKLNSIGFLPEVSLKVGLEKCFDWYSQNINLKIK